MKKPMYIYLHDEMSKTCFNLADGILDINGSRYESYFRVQKYHKYFFKLNYSYVKFYL